MNVKIGDVVRLVALSAEDYGVDVPPEEGVVVTTPEDGMIVVHVNPEFVDGPTDDGLRELSTDQVEKVIGVVTLDMVEKLLGTTNFGGYMTSTEEGERR